MRRSEPPYRSRADTALQTLPSEETTVKRFKLVAALFAVHSMCVSVMPQTSVRITPEAPVGKGIIVLKAARLIDGTGAAAISNGVVVVEDNVITAVGPAGSVRVPANAKMI